MIRFIAVETFEDWREQARSLLSSSTPPQRLRFTDRSTQANLFESSSTEDGTSHLMPPMRVPREFLETARHVACHRDSRRWDLLYRTLWRLTREERNLLQIETDDDVSRLFRMQKAVRRDVHNMKAFVRFKKVEGPSQEEQFIAWHRPDHRIVRLAAPFFARRFKGMRWTIFTPDESADWDGHRLVYGAGVPSSQAPHGDELQDLWKTYYRSIFNPARVKIAAMKHEMPVRYWPTMPETQLIGELLAQAPSRVEHMIERQEGFAETAMRYLPQHLDLQSLRAAAGGCQACDLHGPATQTVFGTGASNARLVIVGEQPGDLEDLAGKPFVGPAGQLLDEALAAAGQSREGVYPTNAVKHFGFIPRGERRLHKKPSSRQIYACRPWLEAELASLQPEALLCLGATAAQTLLGRDFRLSEGRGQLPRSNWCARTFATWHPAAILRARDGNRQSQFKQKLFDDLRLAIQSVAQAESATGDRYE